MQSCLLRIICVVLAARILLPLLSLQFITVGAAYACTALVTKTQDFSQTHDMHIGNIRANMHVLRVGKVLCSNTTIL